MQWEDAGKGRGQAVTRRREHIAIHIDADSYVCAFDHVSAFDHVCAFDRCLHVIVDAHSDVCAFNRCLHVTVHMDADSDVSALFG